MRKLLTMLFVFAFVVATTATTFAGDLTGFDPIDPVNDNPTSGSGEEIDLAIPKALSFVAGDTDSDGIVDAGDLTHLIGYVIMGSAEAPVPYLSGDVDLSGTIDYADVDYLINYLYRQGPAPRQLDYVWCMDYEGPDGVINKPDATKLEVYLFNGGTPPTVVEIAANVPGCNGNIVSPDIGTLTEIISYLNNGEGKPAPLCVEEYFTCADLNGDSITDEADLSYMNSYLFNQGPAPECGEGDTISCADLSGDGIVDIADVTALIDYLYISHAEPTCAIDSDDGSDSDGDDSCDKFGNCTTDPLVF